MLLTALLIGIWIEIATSESGDNANGTIVAVVTNGTTSSIESNTSTEELLTSDATSVASSTTLPPTTTVSSGSMRVIFIAIGCGCGVAFLITLTLLIVFLLLWRKKVKVTSNSSGRVGMSDIHMDRNNSAKQTINQEPEVDEEMQRIRPIPISEFSEVVKRKHFNANIAFEDEFESFPTKHESPYTVAKQKHNESKNRFDNIFPYDFSRVVLKLINGDPTTDYINASYINGYKRENAYIAAQGPLRNTIAHFWRMIWEKKIMGIIMLTETVEAGRDKCAQYWPALMDTPWEVGDNIMVTLRSQTQYAAYRMKSLLVQNSAEPDTEALTVAHFHFSAWPDHGVPADKTCLIQFVKRVRKDFSYYNSPPLIVHCSAGVGRSGTFIVLDSMLERMSKEVSFNIYSFICEMREKRALMVQTEAQYTFIHDALEEFITCGDTSIAVTNMRIALGTLSNTTSGKSGYANQLELLDRVSYKRTAMNCNEAERDYNVEKNRYKDYIPYNINRVCLRPGGQKGSDYINASFIDGYKHRKNFIATQGPLKGTVIDFWRMIWEHKCRAIVMLCNLFEDDEESCYQYWPDEVGKSTVHGKYKVKLIDEQETENFTLRRLQVGEDSPYMVPGSPEAMVVTQIHHTKWPRKEEVPSTASVLQMINVLIKVQIRTGNHAIIVMCNDGVGRTGAFTTLYAQIERIKAEQVADIFQFVKGSRFQRADIVYNEALFSFCHQVVADYLTSVDNYANFKDL